MTEPDPSEKSATAGSRSSDNDCNKFEKGLVNNLILKSDQLFRGMTYSALLREWLIWLHSDSPTYNGYTREICYLHGNLSYVYDRETGLRKRADKFQNRARSRSEDDPVEIFRGDIIFDNTPIFVPAKSSFYSVGETYYQDGKKLETIADCQFICRRDFQEGGPTWLTLQKKGCDPVNLSKLLCDVESPSFLMTVTENSPLRERLEMPIEPGTYDTFTTARAALIKSLPAGEYRLHFGGYGRGAYFSDTVHDFIVKPTKDQPQNSILIFPEKEISPPSYEELEPLE
jgi:hypothetical protein